MLNLLTRIESSMVLRNWGLDSWRLDGLEGFEEKDIVGDGEGLVLRHALELVPGAPGVGEENLVRLRIVADDETHVSAGGLRQTGLGKHAERDAPEERNALVDLRRDALEESLETRVLETRFQDDLGQHRSGNRGDRHDVAADELRHRQFARAFGLGGLVVGLDSLLDVLDAAGHGDDGLESEPALGTEAPDRFAHVGNRGPPAGSEIGGLGDLMLVDVE